MDEKNNMHDAWNKAWDEVAEIWDMALSELMDEPLPATSEVTDKDIKPFED
jgi:hypothetical protein